MAVRIFDLNIFVNENQLTSTLGLTGATGGLGTAFKGLGAKIKVLYKYHCLE